MNISEIISKPEIMQEAEELLAYFHENPEISNEEIKTARFLKDYVTNLGYEIVETAGTGFIAVLDSGQPGRTLALRTDIDALPIQETSSNLKQPKRCVSKVSGAMHACGHDAHMSILLIVLKILSQNIGKITGRIIGIFEEGEENGSGYTDIISLLHKFSVDAIYGSHMLNTLQTGKVSVDAGPVMAAYGVFDFTIIGKTGHGSRPDQAVNPIIAGTQIINALNIAWNNQLDVEKVVTLGITKFNSGSTLNIIPETSQIGGTIRFFDKAEGQKAMQIIKKTVIDIADMNHCEIEFQILTADSKPVVNDEDLARIAQTSVQEIFPAALESNVKWFASETFSFYAQVAPTVFSFIGIRNEEKGTGSEHHSSEFEVDSDALVYGIGTMLQFSKNYLSEEQI